MQWQTSLPLIAVLRDIIPDETPAHVDATIAAGFDIVEISLNSPQWQQSIPTVVEAYGVQALTDAGTVLQEVQVDRPAQLEVRLVMIPNVQPAVIRRAIGHGVTACAGCTMASEASITLEAGAQALKIFPSSAFGPGYIGALRAVLPVPVPVFVVGGVTPENLAQWVEAGYADAGLGNNLYHAGQPVARTAGQTAAFVRVYREAVE